MGQIPRNLQGVLWSVDVKNLDIESDKNYIIHQILAYGTWKNLKWLFKTYSESQIKIAFLKYPSKDYRPVVFNFVTKILFGLKQLPDERYYVTTYPRIIG
ncbi:hypothetical protein A2863_01635 [Candidatus Woesebacteria bacterium RIFCSPHIGHO2_01_FULL_38_9b]|uniref:DUF6922 domain-containing protein n=1 Tax=Candidatus Woesebacteria bacterium RIFCSPHIGHO2_01_FULL_38_9b TaxID=1802493 RepID=A0A1F7Y2Q2_9BACT|nr:MAG: hypothetical protein A2863_01635 [Candidatus Woesebacteria bacterium RIFCSPHIGHO2_01_FULL_38_9b]